MPMKWAGSKENREFQFGNGVSSSAPHWWSTVEPCCSEWGLELTRVHITSGDMSFHQFPSDAFAYWSWRLLQSARSPYFSHPVGLFSVFKNNHIFLWWWPCLTLQLQRQEPSSEWLFLNHPRKFHPIHIMHTHIPGNKMQSTNKSTLPALPTSLLHPYFKQSVYLSPLSFEILPYSLGFQQKTLS